MVTRVLRSSAFPHPGSPLPSSTYIGSRVLLHVRKRKPHLTVRLVLLLVALAAAAMLVSLVVSRPLFDEQLDRAVLGQIAIAPPADALTFARYRRGNDM